MTAILIHEAHTETDLRNLIALLSRHAPSGLSLLRRLQTLQATPTPNPQALVISTFAPPQSTSVASTPLAPPHPYAIAFFDRSTPDCLPCFLFSSIELESTTTSNDTTVQPVRDNNPAATDSDLAVRQLLTILAYFHHHRPPTAEPTSSDQFFNATANQSDTMATTNDSKDSDITFAGCVHATTATLLRTHPLATQPTARLIRDDIHGPGGPYLKLVWRASSPATDASAQNSNSSNPPSLPHPLTWSTAHTSPDIARVLATNTLIRLPSQITSRPSAAIRDTTTNALIGWVFSGQDGSVRTLFVEEPYRGQGYGRKLVERLMQTCGDADGWWHTDVAVRNAESRGLFERGFGARSVQESYWMRVDLAVAGRVVARLEREEAEQEGGGVRGAVSAEKGEEVVEGTGKTEKTWKLGFNLSLG